MFFLEPVCNFDNAYNGCWAFVETKVSDVKKYAVQKQMRQWDVETRLKFTILNTLESILKFGGKKIMILFDLFFLHATIVLETHLILIFRKKNLQIVFLLQYMTSTSTTTTAHSYKIGLNFKQKIYLMFLYFWKIFVFYNITNRWSPFLL